jgi:hypothetical protein
MGKNPKVKKMITLKVYKGVKISYNEDRTIQNESQLIKTEHDTNEWKCLMMTLKSSGFCKVVVEKVNNLDSDFTAVKGIEVYQKEVDKNFSSEIVKELTPDQKRIADLERKLEALTNPTTPISESTENLDLIVEDVDLDVLKAEYLELSGKKAHHLWKMDKLIEKIDELKK